MRGQFYNKGTWVLNDCFYPTSPRIWNTRLVCNGWQIQIKGASTCLIISGAHIKYLSIIKVKILVFLKWSYKFPRNMLTIEPRMVIMFWACSPIYAIHMSSFFPFFIYVLGTTPNHIPFKYRCLSYCQTFSSCVKSLLPCWKLLIVMMLAVWHFLLRIIKEAVK